MVNCKINETRHTHQEWTSTWFETTTDAQNEYRQGSVHTSKTSAANRLLCLTSSSFGEEEKKEKTLVLKHDGD